MKLYNYSVIKFVKEQKKSQLKHYQMALYRIKNFWPIKYILKTLPSSGVKNYIKICKCSVLEKQQ